VNTHDNDHDHDDLAARLRRLPAERVPPAVAWQRIAAQLRQAPPQLPPPLAAVPASVQYRRRHWPRGIAAAAVVALVLAGGGRWWATHERPVAVAQASPLQRQADVLAAEYGQAIAAIPPETVPAELAPALHELDSSAGSIRSAIAQSPDAGFLLGQLRRTYALRLELTRQGLAAAAFPT